MSRGAADAGVDALPFVAWRGAIAMSALLLVSLFLGRRIAGPRRLPDIRLLPRHRRWALIAASLCGAILNIAIFAAFLRMSIAVALICFYTFPAIVTIAAVPLYGDRLDRLRLGALVLSMIGLALVVLAPLVGTGDVVVDPLGVGLALVGAVGQATFVLIAGRGFSPLPPIHASVYVVFAALALSAPLAWLAGDVAGLLLPLQSAEPWIWILAGGIAGAAIPTTLFVTGIGMIGPSRAAILMTIEPLVGVALAGLLLGEQPSLLQLVGGAAVLVAAVILQVSPRAPAVGEKDYSPTV